MSRLHSTIKEGIMKDKWPVPLKGDFLPKRLAEPKEVEIDVVWNGKSYPTPAVLSQKENGIYSLSFPKRIKTL